jgi:hypothetical protein
MSMPAVSATPINERTDARLSLGVLTLIKS